MSRNSTDYLIFEIIHVKGGHYESPLGIASTAKKARKIAATVFEAIVKKYRWTPSLHVRKNGGKPKKAERKYLRSLRKDARREADEKKRNACMVTVFDGKKWAKFRYSEWKFDRYLAGMRKGTIL